MLSPAFGKIISRKAGKAKE